MTDIFDFILLIYPNILQGVKVTLEITGVALALGFAIGLPASLIQVYGGRRLRWLVIAYTTIFRGTPLLVQLFVVYYGLPDLGLTLDRLTASFLTLGLNSGAYQAEYFRGAIQSIGQGQMKAARAIGMSRLQAIWSIILPQAFRLAMPGWSNEMISMVKYTAVVFLIAVPDLMGQAKIISSRYFAQIETYIIVALVYLVLVAAASLILRQIAKRLETPGFVVETSIR